MYVISVLLAYFLSKMYSKNTYIDGCNSIESEVMLFSWKIFCLKGLIETGQKFTPPVATCKTIVESVLGIMLTLAGLITLCCRLVADVLYICCVCVLYVLQMCYSCVADVFYMLYVCYRCCICVADAQSNWDLFEG